MANRKNTRKYNKLIQEAKLLESEVIQTVELIDGEVVTYMSKTSKALLALAKKKRKEARKYGK